MLIESDFNPAAISKKGARGLMQLMPEVAAEQGVRDVHDPRENISAGSRQLSHLMSYYAGDLVKSLAAYNAGEAAVDRYAGVPPYAETQLYVRKALAAYYGKSTLGGGFGIPVSETYRGIPASAGKPVQWTRDARTNRVILTTKGRTAPRRLG
jgi:soluble lytic murein transglycosylase-like protein